MNTDILDNSASPRDDIILDSMCLTNLGFDAIVEYNRRNTPKQKLRLLCDTFRRAIASCNFDWDEIMDDDEFRKAIFLACCYNMRFRDGKPASEPEDIDLEL